MRRSAISLFSSPGTKCQGELLGSANVRRLSSSVVSRPSSVVSRQASTFHLNIFFSETTDGKVTKLGMNVP